MNLKMVLSYAPMLPPPLPPLNPPVHPPPLARTTLESPPQKKCDGNRTRCCFDTGGIHNGQNRTWLQNCGNDTYPPPLISIPAPRDDGSPHPRGGGGGLSPNDGPPRPRGGTHTTQQSPEFYYTQRKIFFDAFGACDFLLISYCSWAK